MVEEKGSMPITKGLDCTPEVTTHDIHRQVDNNPKSVQPSHILARIVLIRADPMWISLFVEMSRFDQ
jgi:hypothetical protein